MKLFIASMTRKIAGATLLEAVLAAGLVAGLSAAVALVTSNYLANLKHQSLRSSILVTKDFLEQRVDCHATIGNGCSGAVALRASDGTVVVTSQGSWVGDYKIKATCSMSTKEIVVAAAMPTNDVETSFVRDPSKNELMDWNNASLKVFKPGAGFCKRGFYAPSTQLVKFVPDPYFVGQTPNVNCPAGKDADVAEASCSSNQIAIGGGAKCTPSGNGNAEMVFSYFDTNINGWRAKCCHNSNPTASAYVVCINK